MDDHGDTLEWGREVSEELFRGFTVKLTQPNGGVNFRICFFISKNAR